MNYHDRLAEIDALTAALKCPALLAHIAERIAEHTNRLIGEDHEQTRGRIKALRDLINLPETLQFERDHIAAELTEQSASA